MYTCDKCHRSYRTQNSLTRHAHSHASDNRHQCVMCGVVFYRKDLLTRHSKLHRKTSNASACSSGSDDDVTAVSLRKRCHTACDRCRDSRTKCNGEIPCNTCAGAAVTCNYSRRSSRLSRLPRRPEVRTSKRQGQADAVDLWSDQGNSSAGEPTALDRDNRNVDLSLVTQLGINQEQSYRPHLDRSLPEAPLPTGSSAYLAVSEDDLIGNTVTWPWLHEDLFLPMDLDMFAMPLDSLEFSAFRSAETMVSRMDPHTILAPFQTDNFGILNEDANLLHAAESVSAETYTQNDTSVHGNLRDETAILSVPSASRKSFAQTFNVNSPAATAGTDKLEQNRVVQDLVAFAVAPRSGTRPSDACASFWEASSTKVAQAFELPYMDELARTPALYCFCNEYLEHFAPLWPLLSRHYLDYNALHPTLFLVLTSIGAMYCGPQASNYGAMMHTQIRGTLTMSVELEDDDHDFVWLAQARLLTQVAALYFGQPKAFTFAHHLGALLVAQAQRNNLFSAVHASKILRRFNQMKGIVSDKERFRLWLQLETRRRLAFGIFRGDTYTSVLLHTKPLISMEEIDLWLPTCDAVWRSENLSASLCLQMIEHDRTPSRELWASDIFRIAMDSKEPLPPLSPSGQELLMFGLQYPIWRFSKDREMFVRLTGERREASNCSASLDDSDATPVPSADKSSESTQQDSQADFEGFTDSEAHHVGHATRRMADLQQERERLLSTLARWKHGLPLVKTFAKTNLDRSSLMSSLILYQLGFIRLLAPLEELHQIQHRIADRKEIDGNLVDTVRDWALSDQGRAAAECACNIWNIIAKESNVERSKRVRFNLLAFIGLHHSAVLLWAYALVKPSDPRAAPLALRSNSPVVVDRSHSAKLLSSFVTLYDTISPAQWSSFAKATSMLLNQPFPQAGHRQ